MFNSRVRRSVSLVLVFFATAGFMANNVDAAEHVRPVAGKPLTANEVSVLALRETKDPDILELRSGEGANMIGVLVVVGIMLLVTVMSDASNSTY